GSVAGMTCTAQGIGQKNLGDIGHEGVLILAQSLFELRQVAPRRAIGKSSGGIDALSAVLFSKSSHRIKVFQCHSKGIEYLMTIIAARVFPMSFHASAGVGLRGSILFQRRDGRRRLRNNQPKESCIKPFAAYGRGRSR